MRVFRVLRGILGTALTFAVPWAVFGGALVVAIELVWNGPLSAHSPFYYVEAALSSAAQLAVLGFAVGAAFAGILAVAGRKLAFDQLTASRVLGLGVTGGLAVTGSLLGLLAQTTDGWPMQYSVALGVSALLGGVSALSMLQIARCGSAARVPPELSSGTDRALEVSLERESARRAAT